MAFCINYGDNLFISKYLGLAALGVYQLAYDVSNLPATNITHVLGRIGFPTYARLQSDRAALRGAFLRVMRATLLLAGPVSVLLFVGASDLVSYVLGEKWVRAIPLIRILSIAGLIRAFAALAGPLFHAVGRADLDFKMNLPRFFCTIVGLWPAAHFFGLEGVCAIVLIAITCGVPRISSASRRTSASTAPAVPHTTPARSDSSVLRPSARSGRRSSTRGSRAARWNSASAASPSPGAMMPPM